MQATNYCSNGKELRPYVFICLSFRPDKRYCNTQVFKQFFYVCQTNCESYLNELILNLNLIKTYKNQSLMIPNYHFFYNILILLV